jgi:hypothetical protein
LRRRAQGLHLRETAIHKPFCASDEAAVVDYMTTITIVLYDIDHIYCQSKETNSKEAG